MKREISTRASNFSYKDIANNNNSLLTAVAPKKTHGQTDKELLSMAREHTEHLADGVYEEEGSHCVFLFGDGSVLGQGTGV